MIEEYIRKLVIKIDKSIIEEIDPNNGVLESAIHYALSIKCKRLRPLLFLTLIESFKKKSENYMDIACAIECIHTYSLIHDDLPAMDNDDYRRGELTVHKKYNEAIALLAGDTLLTFAFEKISKSNVEAKTIVNILKIITTGIGIMGMAGGQVLDLEFDGNKDNIFMIHKKKTAELIRSSLLSAAEIVGMNEEEKKLLSEIGYYIGVGFQLADDLLDIEGDEIKVGKKLKKDLKNNSPNSVLYFGKDFVKREIDDLFEKTLGLLVKLKINFPPFLYLMKRMVYRIK